MNNQDIRWQQRFANFQRAFLLLREALENDIDALNQLEKEGVIQRFEYTFELAWKTLKDKIEYDGIILDHISPKAVVKKAYATKYIQDADLWLQMIGDRNLMSHTYDFVKFETVIKTIKKSYLPMLDEWYMELLMEINA
ncbi:MAG: DUF86 domain-containing protein [Methylococcaceae bacterium]|nr:DUF86 domain-containing protein [Methylococcaceae bacterium]